MNTRVPLVELRGIVDEVLLALHLPAVRHCVVGAKRDGDGGLLVLDVTVDGDRHRSHLSLLHRAWMQSQA